MADVNPNQDLRFKEIMKRLIPGAYFYVYVFICSRLFILYKPDYEKTLARVMEGLDGAVQLALWIMIAYISGFVFNSLASIVERMLYYCGLNRPSKKVLTKNGKHWLEDAEKVINDSCVNLSNGRVCQKQAKQILAFAKNHISRKDNLVEEMYYHSIMARNILLGHILAFGATLYATPLVQKNTFFFLMSIILFVIYYSEWRRKNIIYVRNIFVEYLAEHNSKQN